MKHLISLICAIVLLGCSSQPEPDPKIETNRVESAKQMRDAFNRTGGDFDKLSSTEKAEFLKLFNGSEEDARKAWGFMKNPPGGPTQGAPSGGG